MSIGNILHDLRMEQGISQQGLADAIGISQSTIAKIEINRNEATASTIRKLSDYFRISADYLLGRSEDPKGADMPGVERLSVEEKKLLRDYRGLSRNLKDVIQTLIATWQAESSIPTAKRK